MTPDLMLGEIEETCTSAPLSVSATCLDPSGAPVAALSALTMAEPRSGHELIRLGRQVSAAAEAISRRLHTPGFALCEGLPQT